jgi:hypothetical protein
MAEISHSRRFQCAAGQAMACGAASLFFAAVAAMPLTFVLLTGRTRFAWGHVFYFAAVAVTMALPGAIYLWVAWQLYKRRTWGAIAAVVVAAVHDACALVGLIALLWYVPARGGPLLWAPIGGAIFFLLMCSTLLWLLGQVLHRTGDDDLVAGFDVVTPAASQPSESVRGK